MFLLLCLICLNLIRELGLETMLSRSTISTAVYDVIVYEKLSMFFGDLGSLSLFVHVLDSLGKL